MSDLSPPHYRRNLILCLLFTLLAQISAVSPWKMLCCFRRRHMWLLALILLAENHNIIHGVNSFSTRTKSSSRSTIEVTNKLLMNEFEVNSDDKHASTFPFWLSRRAFARLTTALVPTLVLGSSVAHSAVPTPSTTTLPLPPITDHLATISNDTTALILAPVDYFTQFNTANDVPADYFTNQRYIYGFVERVIDGDTIRVRHVPGFGIGTSRKPEPLQQRGIANSTLSIRIYGVDAPETGKNKRQISMPFGDDAKQFTTDLVYHKMVKITLLRRDQYNRAVAVVETIPEGVWETVVTGTKDLSMELAAAGLAELYAGGGAEYYGRRNELEVAIATAQRCKRGIWSMDNRQSAADFKRQQKQSSVAWQPQRGGAAAATHHPLVSTTLHNHGLKVQASNKFVAKNAKSGTHGPSNKENMMDLVVTGLEFVG